MPSLPTVTISIVVPSCIWVVKDTIPIAGKYTCSIGWFASLSTCPNLSVTGSSCVNQSSLVVRDSAASSLFWGTALTFDTILGLRPLHTQLIFRPDQRILCHYVRYRTQPLSGLTGRCSNRAYRNKTEAITVIASAF